MSCCADAFPLAPSLVLATLHTVADPNSRTPNCCLTGRYYLHPGVFDATIHLAPVPAAGQEISGTRVPVSASFLRLPAAPGSSRGWALAESVGISRAGQSAETNIFWSGAVAVSSGQSGLQMVSLLAKAVGRLQQQAGGATSVPAGQELLYSLEWQASNSGSSSPAAAGSIVLPQAWSLLAGDGTRLASARAPSTASDSHFAAGNLGILQQVNIWEPAGGVDKPRAWSVCRSILAT